MSIHVLQSLTPATSTQAETWSATAALPAAQGEFQPLRNSQVQPQTVLRST